MFKFGDNNGLEPWKTSKQKKLLRNPVNFLDLCRSNVNNITKSKWPWNNNSKNKKNLFN